MSVTSQEAVNVTDASGNDVKALTKLTEDMKILDVQSQESPTFVAIKLSCTSSERFSALSQALLQITDAEVAELFRQYKSGQKTAKMFGMNIWSLLKSYENGMGVKKVATLGDVPDGAYLACYGELLNLETIQSKNLTCLIVRPSKQCWRLISQLDHFVNGIIAGAACGKLQESFVYACFGPKTLEHPEHLLAETLSSAFSHATDDKRLVKDIYAVDGYI